MAIIAQIPSACFAPRGNRMVRAHQFSWFGREYLHSIYRLAHPEMQYLPTKKNSRPIYKTPPIIGQPESLQSPCKGYSHQPDYFPPNQVPAHGSNVHGWVNILVCRWRWPILFAEIPLLLAQVYQMVCRGTVVGALSQIGGWHLARFVPSWEFAKTECPGHPVNPSPESTKSSPASQPCGPA